MALNQLKYSPLIQNESTKTFIQQVKTLVNTGVAKNRAEIVEALDWDSTTMSNVMNGRYNVPPYVYSKFIELYGLKIETPVRASIEQIIAIDAKCTVILSTLAEILANQRGTSVAKINEDLVAMVNSQVKLKLEKL